MEQISPEEATFFKVYEAPNLSKDWIFDKTKIWIAENFRSAKAVVEYEDKSSGVIIGNGQTPFSCLASGFDPICSSREGRWTTNFTMRVDMKDNKFKVTFSNLRETFPPNEYNSSGIYPVDTRDIYDNVKPELLRLADRLSASMSNTKSKGDW
jgi:hypothetical protein